MEKSTFSPLYEHFRARLVALRVNAGMSQRDLAKRLGREHSFVGRVELGERRLDIVEAFWVFRALEADPVKAMSKLMLEFAEIEGKQTRGHSPRRRRGE